LLDIDNRDAYTSVALDIEVHSTRRAVRDE
jgi:hypothetical protein